MDPDILEKTGCEVATLGEQLESVFGWQSRTSGDGRLPIEARGPGIEAIHGILERHFLKHPDNSVLKKWIIDICEGVEKAYKTHGKDVSFLYSS